ncbi:ABC transporter permease subunit [Mesobacillus jeotgali]|jgi:peptide/nickel transport system permease protein|uniref:ABC transporter permease subunit n=1 Tax=Mesobacillus jeotgali TaxID=129985 RepID=A0ABY9VI31_9BACI|nr:ABC transporter permease subunit [Mesobacillus jeotgali]WNF22476.1 ABC transporter permease subunit [Mesobacillus jeotgali]
MKLFVHYLFRGLCILAGTVLFLSIPRLFYVEEKRLMFGPEFFLGSLQDVTGQIFRFNPSLLIHQWMTTNIAERYFYTLQLLGLSLLAMVTGGIILTGLFIITPKKIQSKMKDLINFSEAVPDLLIIFILQFVVIYMYKETGIKLFRLYGLSEKSYLMPVLVVSLLPSFFMAQFLIKEIESEWEKDYVIFAKSKGLHNLTIYFKHILRNVLPMAVIQLRTLIWILLSNLVLIEYLFALQGFTKDMDTIFTKDAPSVIVFCVLIAVPILFVDLLARITAHVYRGKDEVHL